MNTVNAKKLKQLNFQTLNQRRLDLLEQASPDVVTNTFWCIACYKHSLRPMTVLH